MRRLLVTVALVAALVLGAPAASAQSEGDPTSTTVPEPGGDIIPEPNSGQEPEDPGDRGGSLQTLLFIGMVGGVVLMGWLVVRQSRRARADRGF